MNKLKLETPDLTAANVQKLQELFPGVVNDGQVNFDLLRSLLGDAVAGDEAYEFTWVGKRAAIAEAGTPIRKTLRPCPAESKDWEKTENIYIEGDNLDALKLLQESYLGKVKMIYIDPPYNTGNDFVYKDNFAKSKEDYDEDAGVYNEDGDKLFRNTQSNGRFHSDWCSMMYPRLMLARNLLSDDGAIFVSIDDNEIVSLRKICDEIFGENNFISTINWKGRGGKQDSKYYAAVHEYIMCYSKNKNEYVAGSEIKSGDVYQKYDAEKCRYYKLQLLRKWGSKSRKEDRPNLYYPIIAPDGSEVYPIVVEKDKNNSSFYYKYEGRWRHGKDTMQKNIDDGNVEFVKQIDGSWVAYEKIYAPLEGEERKKKYTTWIDETCAGVNSVKELFSEQIFDYPKSPVLIERFIKMANVEYEDIILDFFSGSATTAHAVMQLNAEDGGKRKFIMVQLPEVCPEDSEAARAGYANICEIGKERIRRAGEKIKADNADKDGIGDLDVGFRVFKVDSTNMKDVYYNPAETNQGSLTDLVSNIKDDRNDLDLLFGCLLDWALPLSCPHTSEEVDGATIHIYKGGELVDLVACFADNISETVVRAMAGHKPLRAVFRDACFADAPGKINVQEIFKSLSPATTIRVL